jgi:hypothetical protein
VTGRRSSARRIRGAALQATGAGRPFARSRRANAAGVLLSGGSRLRAGEQPVHHHLGVSAFATHAVVSRHSVVRVGADVPPRVAALLGCALLTGGGAVVNVLKPQPDDALAVVGLGGVGMAAVVTARACGVRRNIGVDTQPSKLDIASELGATETYTPQEAAEAACGDGRGTVPRRQLPGIGRARHGISRGTSACGEKDASTWRVSFPRRSVWMGSTRRWMRWPRAGNCGRWSPSTARGEPAARAAGRPLD